MALLNVSLGQLPWKTSIGGLDLVVDNLEPKQVDEVYRLVCREAGQGQDVGMDEFASKSHLRTHIKMTDGFGVFDAHTGKLYALIAVAISTHCRSVYSQIADGIIICDADVKATIRQFLIQTTISLAVDLDYQVLLIEAFRTSPLVGWLTSEGFIVIGCIPNSGKLNGKGWTDSFILFKNLQSRKDQLTPGTTAAKSLHQSMVDDSGHGEDADGDDDGAMSPLVFMVKRPRLTYLPCRHTFSSGEYIVRYLQEEDVDYVYSMYKETSQRGRGYSTDEFMSLEVFRFFVIDNGHPFVVEDPASSKILAAFTLNPSTNCRSVDPLNGDAYMIVDPKLQKLHLGSEVSCFLTRFSMDLGYTGAMGDSLVRNSPMLKIIKNQGFSIVAYIPGSAKGTGQKMEDSVIFYRDLQDKSKFIAKI